MSYKELRYKCHIYKRMIPECFMVRDNYRIKDRNRIIYGWICLKCKEV